MQINTPKIARIGMSAMALLFSATSAMATPAYNPPGMDLGALPTPIVNGVMQPLTFSNTPNWNISPVLTKFVDTLAPLGCSSTSKNNLGQCIPVATPDITTYPGSDYYEIELIQYTEKMHSELGPTTLRGYHQTNSGTDKTGCTDPALNQPNACTTVNNTVPVNPDAHYLGPVIVATKDRPVRIKFTNNLPTGAAGNLFLPVDTTIMGAGKGPLQADGITACSWVDVPGTSVPFKEHGDDCASYTQNRAELHLHGGLSPWISDGTPHQWVTPVGEVTPYKKGVSYQNVPDMPDPGDGSITYYYTNQQSARLMFYHDHAVGLTRLNVYAGEAAGYLITDDTEKDLVARRIIPGKNADEQLALIIQDKNFVDPATIAQKDPTWIWGTKANPLSNTNTSGDLWWPHVYMVAENPYVADAVNPMGRWVYGLWFWPPTTGIPFQLATNPYYDPACDASPTAPGCVTALAFEPPVVPKTPNPSWVAEAFMDIMMVNGTAYPKLSVEPKAYRLRILNAAHDRFLNLQLYKATTTIKDCTISNAGSGYEVGDLLTLQGSHVAGKYPQDAEISVSSVDANGAITGFRIDNYGSLYITTPPEFNSANATMISDSVVGTNAALTCTTQSNTEVAMAPAVNYREYNKLNKNYIPNDNRDGGVPNPTTAGPDWIQIGTEGGFLAKPAVIPPFPVTFLTDPTQFNVGNVIEGSLRMGPAERADVVVDFSQYAGQTLILYNDAPAAYPAAVANNDYYTGAPDLSDAGGAAEVKPGTGPNTRTIMQITVGSAATDPSPFSLSTLQNEFKSTAPGGGVFQRGQEPIIVGQEAYNDTYGVTFPWRAPNWGMSEIGDNYISYFDPTTIVTTPNTPTTTYMNTKAIHDEMGAVYDEYGRMSARLGVEVPFSTNLNANFVMQAYVDPPTEIVDDGQVQLWKITHNGVDTHPMHFHLFDVQLVNRVGWDGFKRLPDANELGWKETVRVSPLEDTIVALKPRAPKLPFGLPDSIRKLAPALPDNTTQGFTNLQTTGPQTGQAKTVLDNNQVYNFGDEYVWHCHILSHEEQDMMRPVQFNTDKQTPDAPTGLSTNATYDNGVITLTWNDPTPVANFSLQNPNNPKNEVGFVIERCNGLDCSNFAPVGKAIANATTYTESVFSYDRFSYVVKAYNARGESLASNIARTQSNTIINGVCGSSNGQNFAVVPTTGLCLTGEPSLVTNTNGVLTWTCSGLVPPTAPVGTVPVNDSCTAAIPTYQLTFQVGTGLGSLNGTTPQTVTYSTNAATVTAVPATGFHFVNWTENGTPVSTTDALTLTNVTAAKTYVANFAIDTFAINFLSTGPGTLSGTTSQIVDYFGAATPVTATATAPGNHFVNWTENGVAVSTNTTLPNATDVYGKFVTSSHTFTANFAVDTFNVSYTAGANGTLSAGVLTGQPAVTQMLDYNTNAATVTAVPNPNYYFVNWMEGTTQVSLTPDLTIQNVVAAHAYTANFALTMFNVTLDQCVSGATVVGSGTTPTYTFTSGFDVAAKINGTPITVTNGSYTYPAPGVLSDLIFSAAFTVNPVGTTKVARIVRGANVVEFDTVQAAYIAANNGETIMLKGVSIAGAVNFNLAKTVTLKGGYNADFTANCAFTKIGVTTFNAGTVKFDRVSM